MNSLFKKLVETPSVSGKEKALQKLIDQELKSYVDEIKTDALGNNIKKTGNGKIKVMLTAHCDEVGFIVTYIDEKGFAYFKPIGGIEKDITIGQKVNIFTQKGILPGVIGRDPSREITSKVEAAISLLNNFLDSQLP